MKKQNFIITSLFLFWVIGTTTAQTITGKVINIHAQAIDGATVILQTIDSTFVDAVITDTTGYFRFNRQPASYRLIFQHIMYETLLLTTTGEDAGTITLKSKDYALDEVIVKGERPLVKVEGGKLSYDLSQLTTHKIVSNAYEILQQLPGVQEINGNLSLAGTHNLSIILNGRPTTMSHEQLAILLKNTPASRVEKAEIMYSTPPQYHVRGAAINLLLKGYRPEESGLQGEVNAGYLYNYRSGTQGGISLLYTTPKWNIDLLYNTHYEQNRQTTDTYSHHTLKNNIYDIIPKALDALHIENSASHAEFKIGEDGSINIIEIGARMGGDCIGSHLVEISTGYDFLKMTLDVALGNKPDMEIKNEPHFALIKFIFDKKDLENVKFILNKYPEIYSSSMIDENFNHEVVDSSSRFGYYIFDIKDKNVLQDVRDVLFNE